MRATLLPWPVRLLCPRWAQSQRQRANNRQLLCRGELDDAKKTSTMTPVSWQKMGTARPSTRCGRYSRLVASRRNASL